MEHLAKCLEMKYTEFLNGLGGQLMESALTWTKMLLKHLEGSNCKKGQYWAMGLKSIASFDHIIADEQK